MDSFKVSGPTKLSGTIEVEGSKNSALPIMAASLLYNGKVVLNNIPRLKDINSMISLLESMGALTQFENNSLSIDNSGLNSFRADYNLVRKMRASFIVLGGLLARKGRAEVSLPGGCAIGQRPVDIHIKSFEALGIQTNIKEGYVYAQTSDINSNEEQRVELEFPSVGATENLMIFAAGRNQTTIINNAAKEPEIVDLANFLEKLGAKVSGAGTAFISIKGFDASKESPSETVFNHDVIFDRIVAGTYAIAGIITESHITVKNVNHDHLKAFYNVLEQIGVNFILKDNEIEILPNNILSSLNPVNLTTLPFPGFPTDLQAQIMILLTQIKGKSKIFETIFENRFMHVPEYTRLGAVIEATSQSASIAGPAKLKAAPVMCTDLRASAGLVLGAMVAEGETMINRVYHLDRGYEEMEKKLKKAGLKIERVKE
ncbi:UDP-N-acetylglucosamine 1-carboxyvinyltransferase [Bacteriovoracaceae bacterium]|nr:UDP-N-acetylglucosamine 1-carboxyvinyltransferase [Bacteriovoracaceae bacterium]